MAFGIRLALRLVVWMVRWSASFNCTISTQLSVVNSFYCRLQRSLKVRTVGLQLFDNCSIPRGHVLQQHNTYTSHIYTYINIYLYLYICSALYCFVAYSKLNAIIKYHFRHKFCNSILQLVALSDSLMLLMSHTSLCF